MPWFKIDDGFHSHPKILAAGNAATGLFVRLGSYCSQHSTDGVIPGLIAKAYGSRAEIRRLCDIGLIVTHAGGFLIPDFLEYNPSAAKVAEERAKARQRMARNRTSDDVRPNSERSSDGVRLPRPVPSRPDRKHVDTSSSVLSIVPDTGPTDDDPFEHVIALICDAKVAEYHPTKPRAYRAAVRQNTIADDGELIRRMLATDPPDQVALFVLGHGLAAERERTETAWCTPECPDCDGDGWTRTPEGLAPCPQRTP